MNSEGKVPWKWSFYVRAILLALLAVLVASILFYLITFFILMADGTHTLQSFLTDWLMDGYGLVVIGIIFMFCAPPALLAGAVLGRLLHVDAYRGRLTLQRGQWIGAAFGFVAGLFPTLFFASSLIAGIEISDITITIFFSLCALSAATLTGLWYGRRLARMYGVTASH